MIMIEEIINLETGNGIYTRDGTLISTRYERILKNNKFSYFEISDEFMNLSGFHIPKIELFRFTDPFVYRIKFISNDESMTECYYQTKMVNYIDFKLGFFYVKCEKVFDIVGNRYIIETRTNENANKFFE
jgi:hypothetical protein